jgi:hypothetical protein
MSLTKDELNTRYRNLLIVMARSATATKGREVPTQTMLRRNRAALLHFFKTSNLAEVAEHKIILH